MHYPGATAKAVGGDPDLAQELVGVLIAGLPAGSDELRSCAGRNDPAGLAEAAHHMRGATRYCGVLALDAALEGLERAAKAHDPEGMAAGLEKTETEAAPLIATMT